MVNPYFIVNPVAGGGKARGRFSEIQARLEGMSLSYTALYSEKSGHTSQLAREALSNGAGIVIAAGGDGTVREIGQELLNTGVPLGILPLGTGNDLIKTLGISQDYQSAFGQLLSCRAIPMDAATANGKLFLNVSGFGFDVDVLMKTEHYKKSLGGSMAYVAGVVHALAKLRPYRIQADTPLGAIDMDVILLAAGNGCYFGGGMKVAPLADPADGLLDFCIAEEIPRRKVLPLLTRFIKGQHLQLDFVKYIKAKEMTLTCSPGAKVQLDGEIIEYTPVTFKVLPGALSVVRPG